MDCENIKDFETIIWENRKEVVKGALENTSDICDGVTQIKVDTGDLCYASFTTGEVENPANRVVEVYRIGQGFDRIGYMLDTCNDCEHLYTCDNYWEDDGEDIFEGCLVDKLVEDFGVEFDDIMSSVYAQIQEYGFDLN